MRQNLRGQAGFTIVETLVAALILIVGTLSTLMLLDRANKTTVDNRAREGATNLAREVTEAARGIQYERIAPSLLAGIVRDQPGFGDLDAGTPDLEIQRRGFTYTVALTSCIYDDPRDGGGNQSAGPFCAGSAAPNTPTPGSTVAGAVDRNPEDYKRVSATVSWTSGRVARSVRQEVLINNPGSAGGPAVRLIRLDGYTVPLITSQTQTSVGVQFETSSRPEDANWMLDAVVQSPKPVRQADPRVFRFDWNFGALDDGVYVVGAEAFDFYGVAGPARSLSVTLNRFPPRKPTGVVGGRNQRISPDHVELEWRANLERDIIGYTVERNVDGSGGGWTTVCGLQTALTCRDEAAPEHLTVRYRVRAWDRDHATNQPRHGDPSDEHTVLPGPVTPPDAIADLTSERLSDFTYKLRWTRPAGTIRFYRIYRDGIPYASRYANWYTPNATVEYVDGDTGGMQHEYWITTVDERYAESAAVPATPLEVATP